MKGFIACLIGSVLIAGAAFQPPSLPVSDPLTPPSISAVQPNSTPRIRLLALKHSKEHMADGDADLAINAANKAAAKGLNIKVVGNHFIDKNGKSTQVCIWEYAYDLDRLKDFVSQQMKVDAEPGDTFIVFTIGHGSAGGHLHNLGQRQEVMKFLVKAAEENKQKTLWWQLSCYASASLPRIDSLTPEQQKLFSIYASSPANQESAAGVQGKIMDKLFNAMAEKSSGIDENQDGIITASELKKFLGTTGSGKGDLFFADTPDEPIFGQPLRIKLPIVDRKNPGRQYPDDYILYPKF